MQMEQKSFGKTQPSNKPSGPGKYALGIAGVALLVLLLVWSNRSSFHFNFPSAAPAGDSSIPASEVPQYEAFAKTVAVALNNIGFHNINNKGSELAPYFAQDILFDVQNSYITPEVQQLIVNSKAYCVGQDIQAIQTFVHLNQVSSWFTGTVAYQYKDRPGVIRIPFSFRLIVQKVQNQFKVVKFVLLTGNKGE